MPDEITPYIVHNQPVLLGSYMSMCNNHYYATRDPLGAPKDGGGDFTTAPEISQLFGDLLGLWAIAEWQRLGSPPAFALVEFGPGRGTLMRDILRVARVRPAFLDAMQVHLVETSPLLRKLQAKTLQPVLGDKQLTFHDYTYDLPALPLIVIANEFFDALPVEQFTHTPTGWLQKGVTPGTKGLALCDLPVAETGVPADLRTVPIGVIVEYCQAARGIMQRLCANLAKNAGSAVIVDYGDKVTPEALVNGDTLQAMHHHQRADPLQNPGVCDLTCHVDFAPLLRIARDAGLQTAFGTQGDFLKMLGIEARAAAIGAPAADLDRLIADDQMGSLFKVMTVSSR